MVPCLIFVRIMAGVPAMPACGMSHLSVYPTRFWASLPFGERLTGKVKEPLFRRGVYHTLCSWRWETSQLSDDVWDMATVDAHGMFYQQHPSVWRMYPHWHLAMGVYAPLGVVYCIITSAWVSRCSFDIIGQCEGPSAWNEWLMRISTLFLFSHVNRFIYADIGRLIGMICHEKCLN